MALGLQFVTWEVALALCRALSWVRVATLTIVRPRPARVTHKHEVFHCDLHTELSGLRKNKMRWCLWCWNGGGGAIMKAGMGVWRSVGHWWVRGLAVQSGSGKIAHPHQHDGEFDGRRLLRFVMVERSGCYDPEGGGDLIKKQTNANQR